MVDRSAIGKSNSRTAKAHERRVAKLLTEWSNIEFRRRRVEGRLSDTILREMTGDVITTIKPCRVNVECKKGKSFSITALLSNPNTCMFTKWWHQSSYDAKLATEAYGYEIYPMLFFKPHVSCDWIAISKNIVDKFNLNIECGFEFDYYERSNEITFNVSHSKKNLELVPLKLQSCVICDWKAFSSKVDPSFMFL